MLLTAPDGSAHQDVERGDDVLRLGLDARLLQEFPDGCRPDRLAEFDLAAGKAP